MRIFLETCLLFTGIAAGAALFRAEQPQQWNQATVLSVHDGDTLRANVKLWTDLTLEDQDVRIADFDAPEISRTRRTVTVTDAEIVRGKAARDDLRTLLANADAVYLSPTGKRDPYGRLSARVSVWDDGQLTDVAEWMDQHGHSR